MGQCCSSGAGMTQEERKRAKQLAKIGKALEEKEHRELKILLLGPGESGKSTIFKQMHLLYGTDGFNDAIRHNFKHVIQKNVLEWMYSLIKAAEKFNLSFESKEEQDAADIVVKAHMTSTLNSTSLLRESLLTLWGQNLESGGSPPIKNTYKYRARIYFELGDSGDSLLYFFERLDQIFSPNYMPSDQDILRARLKTASILENAFTMGKFDFRFVDVGGQRSERRKWIHCFNNVTSILFIVAISAYNQTLYEDSRINRMHDALDVWDEVVHNPTFKNTPIILFLNKHDLFLEKIRDIDMTVCFPEYTGPPNDAEQAQEYVRQKFVERRGYSDTELFCHFTNATDTRNIEKVWKDCRSIILLRSLQGSGMASELED